MPSRDVVSRDVATRNSSRPSRTPYGLTPDELTSETTNSSSSNHPALRTLGQTVRLLLKACQFRCFGVRLRDMQHDPGADRTEGPANASSPVGMANTTTPVTKTDDHWSRT